MPLDAHDRARPDPEALLEHVQAEERAKHRGQLKIFLGYASGVGKSFRMFDEGRRRRERGEDVVVAAMQPDMDPETGSRSPARSKSCPDSRSPAFR